MSKKILTIDIGTPESDMQDFIEAWETGKEAQPIHKLTFESMKGFTNAFSPKRWELMQTLKEQGSQTIYQLAKILGRDYKNTHTDVNKLLELGLLEKDDEQKVLIPWDEIETHFKLSKAA